MGECPCKMLTRQSLESQRKTMRKNADLQEVIQNVPRSLKGVSPQKDLRTHISTSLFFFCFLIHIEVLRFPNLGTSRTLTQNEPFLFETWLSQVYSYSEGKRLTSGWGVPEGLIQFFLSFLVTDRMGVIVVMFTPYYIEQMGFGELREL